MPNAICEHCGKEFWSTRKGTKYCNSLCVSREFQKRKHGHSLANPKYIFPCGHCGKEVRTNDKRKKFCNSKCSYSYQNAKRKTTKEELRYCPICESEFKPMQKRGVGRKYCSPQCKNKADYQRNKTYSDKQSWEKKALQRWGGNWLKALKRDGYTCQDCGLKLYPSQWTKKRKIVVHHRDGSGEESIKNNSLENLITLCEGCHRHYHNKIHLIFKDGEYLIKGDIFKKLGLDEVKTYTVTEE